MVTSGELSEPLWNPPPFGIDPTKRPPTQEGRKGLLRKPILSQKFYDQTFYATGNTVFAPHNTLPRYKETT